MKKHKEMNPYFALHHGRKVLTSDIKREAPHTIAAVDALMVKGEMIGQHTLPGVFSETEDIQLWIPARLAEREAAAQIRLEKVRAELKAIARGEDFDTSIYNPRIQTIEMGTGHPVEMAPGKEYTLS